jgi:hypothetical protein
LFIADPFIGETGRRFRWLKGGTGETVSDVGTKARVQVELTMFFLGTPEYSLPPRVPLEVHFLKSDLQLFERSCTGSRPGEMISCCNSLPATPITHL